MTSIIKKILFNDTDEPLGTGRVIKFEGRDETLLLTKGSIKIRILTYLSLQSEPVTSKEIAKNIKTTSGRVSQALVDLVSEGNVHVIRNPDHQPHFVLSSKASNLV